MGLKDKINEVLDKTDIDDKIIEGATKAKDTVKGAVQNVLDKTDIDEKIVEKASELKDKITGKKDGE